MFRMKFSTESSAFHNDCNGLTKEDQTVKILLEVMNKINNGNTEGIIRDINGCEIIGEWKLR